MSRPRIADPTALTATTAAEAIRDGVLSSEELVRACLARIGAREDEVQAWEHLDPDLALAQAREADAALRARPAAGALHGVPIGIKDIIDTCDLPTENGSPVFAGRRPERDATCVAALRSAGAVIMGKTVTTELALLTPARTHNPHNLAHTPGGSSAGSAAAVADGMVPAALGSQTAGSIIRPASFCGVYGFKPTLGLVPRGGVLMQSHTLDTVGVYGRSVEDLALLTDCMTAFDPDDATSIRRGRPGLLGTARARPPIPPRLAFVKPPPWVDTDPEMQTAFAALAARLGERVVEFDIPLLADVIEWQRIVQLAENAHYYGPLMDEAPQLISPGLTQRLEAGRDIDAQLYLRAITGREPAYRAITATLKTFSAILTPAALGPAPEGLGTTGSPIMNGLWTYLGMPAVSLPLLQAKGLPVGVQLVGPRHDDARLLRTARWLVTEVAD
ncbi:MAG: amidase [Hyphomicrobium sp.]|uniref:amidase n=1 Tax=Hyphomicrobium sp. TaxID=82 RepID=UPI001324F582|nr:amidase [Hyphomicrobium sp.]KAB2942493.1 MAG: amidase [Hyphomicrobium sp.]MBZ0208457.1 amidase [Hyphomicrobium sp.]